MPPPKIISARQFHQDTAGAARAARKSPVIVTNRGRPNLVLLSPAEYQKLSRKQESIGDMLADPAAAEIDFDPPRLGRIAQSVDLR
jgi:prevent-host-death family protein